MKRTYVFLVLILLATSALKAQESLSQLVPERLFQTGLDLLSHQEYGAAMTRFDQFLASAPNQDIRIPDAAYYKAFCALSLYHAQGEKMILDFMGNYPSHPMAAMASYDLANYFYQGKDYSKASTYYAKVRFGSLSSAQQGTGRFRWGYSLFSQKKLLEALDQFNNIKVQAGPYGPAASYYAGFIELSEGDFNNALQDLKRAEENESYSTVVPVLITNAYYRLNQDDELLRYTSSVHDREGLMAEGEILLLEAEVLSRKGRYADALPLYESCFEKGVGKSDRGVMYRAGMAGYFTRNYDKAIGFLEQVAQATDSLGAAASYYTGLAYLNRKEKPLALIALIFAQRNATHPGIKEESAFLTSKLNYDLGKSDEAIAGFEGVLKSYPRSVHTQEIKELLSQAYINANNYNKAIEYIQSLTHRTPAVDKAYQKATLLKGQELYNREEYAAAVEMFEKSLQYPLDPRWATEAAYWSAEAYSVGRKYELAIPLYEKALAFAGPEAAIIRDTRYGLGYAHYNQQEYEPAALSFKIFVNNSNPSMPNYADGQLRYADCLYAQKSFGEALSYYRKVVQSGSPDTDYAELQSGIILSIQKEFRSAVAEFEKVVAVKDSRYADDAIFQLGQIEFEQSHYAAAVSYYTRLIKESKSNRLLPYAYTRRAAAYYNLKNYAQTSDDYITVIKDFAGHPASRDLLLPLQESLNLAGRSDEFDQYLTIFKQANPDAKGIESVEFETAKNLYFNQNYAKAIDNLGRFERDYPESVFMTEARYYQAESYYRLKDYARAGTSYHAIEAETSFQFYNKVVARIGELESRNGNLEQAIEAYQRLSVISTNKKESFTAFNGLMECYFLVAKYDSSDIYAAKIIEQGSVNVSAQNKAMLYMGKNAMARGDNDSAKDHFLATLNAARDEYGAEAKYLLAEIFFLSKDHKQCYETLLALNTEFSAYPDWVGKSFLLLADNFIASGETFQARATLQSLIDKFPRETIRVTAREKLQKIDDEEFKKREMEKADTTGR